MKSNNFTRQNFNQKKIKKMGFQFIRQPLYKQWIVFTQDSVVNMNKTPVSSEIILIRWRHS